MVSFLPGTKFNAWRLPSWKTTAYLAPPPACKAIARPAAGLVPCEQLQRAASAWPPRRRLHKTQGTRGCSPCPRAPPTSPPVSSFSPPIPSISEWLWARHELTVRGLDSRGAMKMGG